MLQLQIKIKYVHTIKINLDRWGSLSDKKNKAKFQMLTGKKLDEINARLEHSPKIP